MWMIDACLTTGKRVIGFVATHQRQSSEARAGHELSGEHPHIKLDNAKCKKAEQAFAENMRGTLVSERLMLRPPLRPCSASSGFQARGVTSSLRRCQSSRLQEFSASRLGVTSYLHLNVLRTPLRVKKRQYDMPALRRQRPRSQAAHSLTAEVYLDTQATIKA